ncbi:hypothetical protein [Pseudosporangium ferrugineum]|uniref:Mycothiol maleylpyruvate isomerase-like protein n=1 Tax=Pseudosporangium ferrugineum TaxID=439699 RepID=A0A2T0S3P1_9ACTN|nr:hypothetical protein [Pseudosporangium ferrugineum]PRY28045.1 hypothetical protein CLV70_109201 [Pseudosporangium ferrugineum]
MPAEDFRAAVQRLLAQVGHWETGRWSALATGTPGTRGDLVHALVQRLADLAADAESRPRRPVPREPDTTLPDQLRVMTGDLLAADAPTAALDRATADILDTRRHL